MKTEILHDLDLQKAVQALQRGLPVIMPTETVYGLAAPLLDEEAIRKVFTIKGRPSDNPLIAHIGSIEMAEAIAGDLPEDFYRLAKLFWPGPLTLVVKRKEIVPSIVSGGLPTIAIRMPSHPLALQLIREFKGPLVAPSANLSGKPSPTLVSDALEDLDGLVPVAIDGGACEVGIESTVLSLFHETPTLLRPGKITKESLQQALGKEIAQASSHGPAYSPGMKYRHYAPNAPIRLVYQPEAGAVSPTMENLYAELRKRDRLGQKEIVLYCDEQVLANEALMNRILRASGQIG